MNGAHAQDEIERFKSRIQRLEKVVTYLCLLNGVEWKPIKEDE